MERPTLYVVGECPAGCGMTGVVTLLASDGRIFFFSPCCAVAWRTHPRDEANELCSLRDLSQTARLPTRAQIEAAGHGSFIVGELTLDDYWRDSLEADGVDCTALVA